MAEQMRRQTGPGDPIRRNPEENNAQANSDAPPDAVGAGAGRDYTEQSDRARGRGSDANGTPAFDEADGELHRKHYRSGAELVSKID
jgi:hypothetical protein